MKSYSVILPILALFISCLLACNNNKTQDQSISQYETGENGVVVSAHPLASKIGLDVLKSGGTAIEAAVAVQFALAVVCPRAGNIGGGGFAIIRLADGSVDALDYREVAPLQSQRDMYLDSLGQVVKDLSVKGGLSIGVPGTVDGMAMLMDKYGSGMSLAELIEPSKNIAENGFLISQSEADRLNRYKSDFEKYTDHSSPFLKADEWAVNDSLIQLNLAETLKLLQQQGRDGFYKNSHAIDLVDKVNSTGGVLSMSDLLEYKSVWRTPIQHDYKEYRVISMPPPSSGGLVLAQMLSMLDKIEIDTFSDINSGYIHAMVEVEKRAYSDRAKYMGDSDFVDIPIVEMLSSSYLDKKLDNYDIGTASMAEQIYNDLDFQTLESYETTHTSIVDKYGNAVSITTTLNSNYGSKVYFEKGGYFLNNEMDDFSSKPGTPNQFGLVGGEANAIAPNKRMLSSMTPTIIEKNDSLYMVLGSPGGSTIITSVLQVFLNVAQFNMPLDIAVNHKRFHHQWLPDHILYEDGCFEEVTKAHLAAKGHKFEQTKAIGKVKAILIQGGKMIGSGDQRNLDDAVYTY